MTLVQSRATKMPQTGPPISIRLYAQFVQPLYKLALPVTLSNDTGRARAAVTAFFALDGFVFASWAVRIPAVKAATGASPGALGIALLGVSAGAIATMMLSGALCRRFGSARVLVGCATWLSLAVALPALTRSAVGLGLGLAVFGIGYGGLDVAMNSLAVDLVAVLRRPVMPSFHAAWSLGGLAGAALGGLAAPALTPLAHFSLVCAGGLAVTAVCGRIILAAPPPVASSGTSGDTPPARGPGGSAGSAVSGDSGKPVAKKEIHNGSLLRQAAPAGPAKVWRTVLVLGVIALCSTYGEGAVSDWGALHLRDDLGAAPGVAAAAYAAFALAEACGRLAGSAALARLGQTRVLAYGGLATCAGMIAAALSPTLPLALAGFALAGLGVANAFPAAMARVGILAGPHGVAAASTLGYAGFLLGPPAIGFLTTAANLRVALTTVSFLAIAATALALTASPNHQSP